SVSDIRRSFLPNHQVRPIGPRSRSAVVPTVPLLAVIGSYGRGGLTVPEEVRTRFREGTRLPLTERLFTPKQARHHLLQAGFEPSAIDDEIEKWQLQLWDLSTPTNRAYELLFTYEHIEILTMWLRNRPDARRK
ncbi:hypothetical protein AB0H49_33805, partial [Nocardia sp. NPDC050713]|uniref:hypothetical protein n=1 Tax=Nocardia sp. NPDC050713 TaxID=3154511 RepID=UPI0034004B9E